MRPLPERIMHRLLRRAGWSVTRVGPGAYVEPIDSERQTRPRVVHPLGGVGTDAHLLTRPPDERSTRTHRHREHNAFEIDLLRHAADDHVAWVLRRLRINVVLDVGGNQGQYATRLRAAGYRGRIVSFEPVAEFVETLRAASADDPKWHVYPFALGEQETTTEIHLSGTMSSMLEASDFGKSWKSQLDTDVTETIDVRRLDAVLDEAVEGVRAPRVFLKMDTQGFDVAVMRGAGDRLAEIRGLQSEVACLQLYDDMPRLPQQLEIYEEAGFEISGMFPVSRHIRTMRVIEFDVMMVRAEAALRRARPAAAAPSGERDQPELGR